MGGAGRLERPPVSGWKNTKYYFMKRCALHNLKYILLVPLLTAMVAIGPLSTDLYLPSLPSIGAALGASVAETQLTLSAFIGGFALATVIYGPLSDRFGRRPVLMAGLGLFAMGSFGCAAAETIHALIAWRFVEAVGGCAGPVVARAVVRDLYGREQAARVLSYMSGAMAVAPSVAPIIGGWIHTAFGWRGHFVALGLVGTLLLLLTTLIARETNRFRDPSATSPVTLWANMRALFRHRTFIAYAATFALSYCCLFSFISGSAYIAMEILGVAPQNFGFLFIFVAGAFVIGAFFSGRLTPRVGILRMIGAGVVIGALAAATGLTLAFAGIQTIFAVVVPMAVVFFSCALVFPNAMAGAISPFSQTAGLASSVVGGIQLGAGAMAGVLVGLLFDGTTRPMFAVIAVTAAGAVWVFFAVLRPAEALAVAKGPAVHD